MKDIIHYLKFKNAYLKKNCRAYSIEKILMLLKKLIFKKNQISGQSSMEFALVLPFLVFIILVVLQLGYLVYLQNLVEHAAHESTRIITTTNSDSIARISAYTILKRPDKENIEININPNSKNLRKTGDIVKVEIAYTYPGIAKIIKFLIGRSMLIKSNCSMRMECGDE